MFLLATQTNSTLKSILKNSTKNPIPSQKLRQETPRLVKKLTLSEKF